MVALLTLSPRARSFKARRPGYFFHFDVVQLIKGYFPASSAAHFLLYSVNFNIKYNMESGCHREDDDKSCVNLPALRRRVF